ncbi:MAG: alpha/beta fold hydrolase [Microcystaceae cyanobacterium]
MKFFLPYSFRPHLPSLIYFPGMDGTGKLFYRQFPDLAPFFNIYCLKLATTIVNSWASLTQQFLTLTQKSLKETQSLFFCGESFGACLALEVALKTALPLQQLVLVNPASSFARYPLLTWGANFTQWIPESLHPTTTLGFLPFLASLNRIEHGDRRQLLGAMRSVSPQIIHNRLNLLQQFEIAPRQKLSLTVPTLILASGQDRLLPSLEEGQRLRSLFPQTNLHILPDSGHACLLEKTLNLKQIFQYQGLL